VANPLTFEKKIWNEKKFFQPSQIFQLGKICILKFYFFVLHLQKRLSFLFSGALSHYFMISLWLYPGLSRGDLRQLAGMYVQLIS